MHVQVTHTLQADILVAKLSMLVCHMVSIQPFLLCSFAMLQDRTGKHNNTLPGSDSSALVFPWHACEYAVLCNLADKSGLMQHYPVLKLTCEDSSVC